MRPFFDGALSSNVLDFCLAEKLSIIAHIPMSVCVVAEMLDGAIVIERSSGTALALFYTYRPTTLERRVCAT